MTIKIKILTKYKDYKTFVMTKTNNNRACQSQTDSTVQNKTQNTKGKEGKGIGKGSKKKGRVQEREGQRKGKGIGKGSKKKRKEKRS